MHQPLAHFGNCFTITATSITPGIETVVQRGYRAIVCGQIGFDTNYIQIDFDRPPNISPEGVVAEASAHTIALPGKSRTFYRFTEKNDVPLWYVHINLCASRGRFERQRLRTVAGSPASICYGEGMNGDGMHYRTWVAEMAPADQLRATFGDGTRKTIRIQNGQVVCVP